MKHREYVIIALISLTLIPLELVWTRIFSAEFFYTFAFLILSLAILGLGLGGLALRFFDKLNNTRFIGSYLAFAGLATIVGPILVFMLGLDFAQLFSSWLMRGKLVLTVLILMSAFFFGGMALALLFKEYHKQMSRLYMADLLAAGVGVIVAILAMNMFGTPVASFLVALPILVASLLACSGKVRIFPATIVLLLVGLCPFAERFLEADRKEPAPVIYTHWDAMSKIKVYDYDGGRGLNIDNVANSPIYSFDGNWADTKPGEQQWGINVSYLIGQFDSCVFLSLGAGGGSDVLQALVEGAKEVHAVEINPHINYMMTHDDPSGFVLLPPKDDSASSSQETPDSTKSDTTADSTSAVAKTVARVISTAEYSGHIYNDPRVKVITEDGRAYVRRFKNKFDVIFSLSSNTWAALSSGAFALAENYLFTTEAFKDYWQSLTPSGFMVMEHQMYTPRLVSEVINALEELSVADPRSHFAVYDLSKIRRKVTLISKRPLTDELRYRALGVLTPEKFADIHLQYPPANDSVKNSLLVKIIDRGWQVMADSAPVNISPVVDDRPFVAQMGLWRNFNIEKMQKGGSIADMYGFPVSKLIMLIILATTIILILPLNLLPYFRSERHMRPVPWLYFFSIGFAFMGVEIILMQKYSLLIGSSLYSVVTVLLTLLVSSGIGSRFSEKFSSTTVFICIIGWLLLDAYVFRHLIYAVSDVALPLRMAITAVLVIPLGFFMGMPFPMGTAKVGELIDWGFAVNGAASVLGSIVILLAALTWGFTAALTLAAVMYGVAFALMKINSAWLADN
jgi:hypothetical protein